MTSMLFDVQQEKRRIKRKIERMDIITLRAFVVQAIIKHPDVENEL